MIRLIFAFGLLLMLAACSKANLLTYRYRLHFDEESIIKNDNVLILTQSIDFNLPRSVDEEYSYELQLIFIDPDAAKKKKVLNLETDTLIVQSSFGLFSVWRWDDADTKVSGQIKILNWHKNSIRLKENVFVVDTIEKTSNKYIGRRTFHRERPSSE